MVKEAFHRSLVYPAALAIRGELRTYPLLRQMRAEQWTAGLEIRERQRELLAAALSYAHENCPWYADRLEATGADGALEVLAAAPFLTKQDVQDSADQIRSKSRPWPVHAKTTGGSTGQPVTVYKDAGAIAAERAAAWLGYGWYGILIGDRGARFWGSPVRGRKRWRRFRFADLAMNRILFSAFGVSEDDLEDYWRRCLSFRPRYLYGYVSMIESFARYLQARERDGTRLDLQAVITTAEILTEPQRAMIAETFGVPVRNEYGCGEVGPIGYECDRGMLHEMATNLYVELLDASGREACPGEEGEVVVTDLRNRAMPLIRYRLVDRAVRGGPCPCGRGLPAIRSVKGREYDFVRTPDGRAFHGEFFMYLVEDLRDAGFDIGRFKVVQTAPDRLRVQVVTRAPEVGNRIQERLTEELRDMRVDVSMVGAVSLSGSGKLRIIENTIDRAGAG